MDRTDDPRRRAAIAVLADVAPGVPVATVRDGAALLVRAGGVLARSRRPDGAAVARREVAVARALASAGVPAVELLHGDQPVEALGGVVTTWRWIEPGRPPATPDRLGALVRTLRERTAARPRADLPPFDPFTPIAAALAGLLTATADGTGTASRAASAAAGAPGDDARWLADRVAALRPEWEAAAADDPLGAAIVHGDLHADNVLSGAAGLLLSDLELSGWGPPSYDLAPAAVAVSRYGGDPGALDAFLAAAGSDPRTWSGWPVFGAVYELWVTAWAVGAGVRDLALAAEGARRVATLRDGARHRWHLR